EPRLPHLALSLLDIVLDTIEADTAVVGVDHGVGGAGILVAGLADAAGIDEVAGDAVELDGAGAIGEEALGPLGIRAEAEAELHVGVADQADLLGEEGEIGGRLLRREQVLPDRLAGAAVGDEEAIVDRLGGLELLEP